MITILYCIIWVLYIYSSGPVILHTFFRGKKKCLQSTLRENMELTVRVCQIDDFDFIPKTIFPHFQTLYPTFSRTLPPASLVSRSLASLMISFNWTQVVSLRRVKEYYIVILYVFRLLSSTLPHPRNTWPLLPP